MTWTMPGGSTWSGVPQAPEPVDLSIDGLLPISEISWQRIQHPSNVLNIGDELTRSAADETAAPSATDLPPGAGPNPTLAEAFAALLAAPLLLARRMHEAFVRVQRGLDVIHQLPAFDAVQCVRLQPAVLIPLSWAMARCLL